jgi:hypothetical protein
VQDAVVGIAFAASGVAVVAAAMWLSSLWSSTAREIFQLLSPGPSRKAMTSDPNGRNEKSQDHAVTDEVPDAIDPLPTQPAR